MSRGEAAARWVLGYNCSRETRQRAGASPPFCSETQLISCPQSPEEADFSTAVSGKTAWRNSQHWPRARGRPPWGQGHSGD